MGAPWETQELEEQEQGPVLARPAAVKFAGTSDSVLEKLQERRAELFEKRLVRAPNVRMVPLGQEHFGVDVRSLTAALSRAALQCNERRRDAEEGVEIRIWTFYCSSPEPQAIVEGASIIWELGQAFGANTSQDKGRKSLVVEERAW